jgi:hypothetical protein
MVRIPITDLEVGKFLPGGNYASSTVRVQPTGYSVLPIQTGLNYALKYFRVGGLPAGSREQNILGSLGTPVDFSIPFATRTMLKRLDIIMVTNNDITLMDYGPISGGLTNGTQFIRKSPSAVETEIFNFQRIIEYGHFVDAQINSIEITENPTENTWIGSVTFDPMWDFAAGSSLITRVRDDLTLIAYHRTSVLVLEGTF